MKKYSLLTLIASSILLVVMFFTLRTNYGDYFEEIGKRYKDDSASAINLSKDVDVKKLGNVLDTLNYVPSRIEAGFVAEFLKKKMKAGQKLETLGDLDKRAWQIPARAIDSLYKKEVKKGNKKNGNEKGSEKGKATTLSYKDRLANTYRNLGIDELDSLQTMYGEIPQIPDTLRGTDGAFEADLREKASKKENNINPEEVARLKDSLKNLRTGKVIVRVSKKIDKTNLLGRNKSVPCDSVIVRLSEETLNSQGEPQRTTIAFARTDSCGVAVFDSLNSTLSYSVLPIKQGYEYGSSKGTRLGKLDKYDDSTLECNFTEQECRIRIFDASTLKRIKEDKSLTIRTPEDFEGTLTTSLLIFFAAWWGLWLFGVQRKKPLDNSLMAILMTLTGTCILVMFSLNDPLMDKLLGVDMTTGVAAGVVAIAIFQCIDFKKFYQGRSAINFDIALECVKWIFKPFRVKVSRLTNILTDRSRNVFSKSIALLFIIVCLPFLLLDLIRATALSDKVNKFCDKLPKGFGYLLAALFITALLFTPFGAAVGGMTVNLKFGGIVFQPSEIAKYLIIFFMAGYFSTNADKIVQFSAKGNTSLFGAKIKTLAAILLGLGALMGLYLILGDMGPALVLAFTFIVLYSIIKSKVDLEDASPNDRMKRIFTCDIAMLIYGVVSFLAAIYVGNHLHSMQAFCWAWFGVWIVIGFIRRQLYETPILFNILIAAFIFGGTLLSDIPESNSVTEKLHNIGERLNDRNEMCTNTWGTLPIGDEADAGENTQVAEGLWGLATGGFSGQGLGNGSPHFIPAFHTDMILESIGEQLGFIGVLFVIALLAILLRKIIVLGYRTSHPFTFYVCMGVAIVTAIQFIIISLGSTGMIPLTGVTVPFLSYGRVSMILNLAAFGIILSIASHHDAEKAQNTEASKLSKQNIKKYNYSISLLSWAYCLIAVIILGVFFYYQFIERDNTLVRPVYVNNKNGIPTIEYNRRIYQLMDKMHAGNIYDRNGVLLATSDKSLLSGDKLKDIHGDEELSKNITVDILTPQRRYYPFGEHLAFMVGDYNSDLYSFRGENNGYVAEWRHLSDLRGFNNIMDNDSTILPKVKLTSDEYKASKWVEKEDTLTLNQQLYNYSALIPFLKAGINSTEVEELRNGKSEYLQPKDIHLTIDARLQTAIQQGMKEELNNVYKRGNINKLRVSAVIIDAKEGDLLASAIYPTPSSERLKSEIVNGEVPSYRDSKVPRKWKSYSDLDMGLMFATAPGSTAKVMSALAALQKCGVEAADQNNDDYTYVVYQSQLVATGDAEWAGTINMYEAIWRSSNCYFINLVNDHKLYPNLLNVYRTVGAQLGKHRPYKLQYSDSTGIKEFNRSLSRYRTNDKIKKYEDYIREDKRDKMKDAVWQWAWGQGELSATPLAMARVASIVANNGKMRPTRYTRDDKVEKDIQVVSAEEAAALGEAMEHEAKYHMFALQSGSNTIGGKTGTANRHYTDKKGRTIAKSNDAWYICYVKPSTAGKNPIAIAVRIERGQGSRRAKMIVNDLILRKLKEHKYIDE